MPPSLRKTCSSVYQPAVGTVVEVAAVGVPQRRRAEAAQRTVRPVHHQPDPVDHPHMEDEVAQAEHPGLPVGRHRVVKPAPHRPGRVQVDIQRSDEPGSELVAVSPQLRVGDFQNPTT